jgi:hypothetical protein
MRVQPSTNASYVSSQRATGQKPPPPPAAAGSKPAATAQFSSAGLQAAGGKRDADNDGDAK